MSRKLVPVLDRALAEKITSATATSRRLLLPHSGSSSKASFQAARCSQVRELSFFQEIARRFKGEVESNPELQKSIKELKEKAGGLKARTKETTEQLYKHVDAAREEAEVKARKVSSVVREKVQEAKEKVSEATVQVKESIGEFRKDSEGEQKKESSAGSQKESSSATEAAGGEGKEKEDLKSDHSSESQSSSSNSTTGETDESFLKRISGRLSLVSSSALQAWKNAKLVDVVRGGWDVVKKELTEPPSYRRKKYAVPLTAERSDRTDVVIVETKKSGWEKRWEHLRGKAHAHPLYKRLKGVKEHPVVAKGQEIAEDIREKWETSDSPVVHKIQDLNDSLFGETAPAMTLKEIRRRDPSFSYPDFVLEVQESIKPVLQSYLKGDLDELKKRCSREVVDRCKSERRIYESQGIFFDHKILHISDLEVKEAKLLGNAPIIIVAFQTQQVYCVRDKHGNITQGGKDEIQTVYYAWAMQQVLPEEMGETEIYPRWQLREMQQLGIQALI